MSLRETGYGCMDWIKLAEDLDWYGAPVNTARNFAFNKLFRNSWVVAQLAASQQGLKSYLRNFVAPEFALFCILRLNILKFQIRGSQSSTCGQYYLGRPNCTVQ
jgi:hypothetical protein